jgi:RNA polymerase sigma factor (sigma-70 family)
MTTTQAGIVLRHIRGLAARQSAAADDRRLLDRFLGGRDEPAFAELLRRHGPMVLGVCRRVLRDPHAADDAFQATFLILARKGGAIAGGESVGGWLYRVAYNTALKAKAGAAARQRRERRAASRTPADVLDEVTGRELLAVLDEELARLPERHRAPLVLCYLEGKVRDEAARELGWSLGTFKRRLDEGRQRLRARLERRGLALPAVLLAAGLGAAVPEALTATARAAAGNAALVHARVALLARASLRAMAAEKLKAVGAAFLVVALVGAGLFGYVAAADPPRAEGREAPAAAPPEGSPRPGATKPAADEAGEKFSGRVLDPDGKPAAGAKVYLLRWTDPDREPKVRAETDKDGRFSFTAPPGESQLFVTAAGCGPAWAVNPGKIEDNPLRLARDDVSVSGRVLDLQGQPVAGATVRVLALKVSPEGKLDKWLEAVKVRRDGLYTEYEYLPMFAHRDLAHFLPPVTTDKDGRFRITGIGRERAVALIVEGPTIETQEVNALTRAGIEPVRLPVFNDPFSEERIIYHPATFNHVAAPCRVISGVVRDKATGKPIAGAVVQAEPPVGNPIVFIHTTADKDGRFRLTGLPRLPRPLRENAVIALPPDGEPYLAVQRGLPEDKDTKPATFNFDLPRGVWLEGQVKDKATGQGVEARLGYFVFQGGPHEAEARTLYFPPTFGLGPTTDKQGKFRIVAAPYRGLIAARVIGKGQEHYRIGVGAEAIKDHVDGVVGGTLFSTYPYQANPRDFDAVAEVIPEKGATTVKRDLVLDPGKALTVQVRGPDGKPLEGVRAHGQFAREYWGHDLLPAEFTLYGLEPGQGRTLLLEHGEKKLVARREIKGDERGPVVVTLQAAAAVVGRLVDDEGRPLKHAPIDVLFRPGKDAPLHMHSRDLRTDADGKFRIEGLLPGLSYSATVLPPEQRYRGAIFEELSLKAGETRDLGKVKPKKGNE